jgi:uncharacterized membrane protein YeaQ/YmgE (transglycosylase-associated protein family)
MISEVLHQWANDLLVWVGFGTLVGLTAKKLLPGRDPGGAVATVLMGIGGTGFGLGLVALIWGQRVTPLSVTGFLAATAGSVLILFFYHLLGGRYFREDGTGTLAARPSRRRRVMTVTSERPAA